MMRYKQQVKEPNIMSSVERTYNVSSMVSEAMSNAIDDACTEMDLNRSALVRKAVAQFVGFDVESEDATIEAERLAKKSATIERKELTAKIADLLNEGLSPEQVIAKLQASK